MSLNTKEKGGKNGQLEKWVKTMVSSSDHMLLKLLAIDKDISLTQLIREIIESFLKEEKDHGRGKDRKQEK